LAAILEELWHRAPEGQRVVAEMVVELDQARKERAASVDQGNILEAGGRRHGAVLDGDNGALVDVNDGVALDRERFIHGDHASRERQLRAC
jgi:hypothetical protein